MIRSEAPVVGAIKVRDANSDSFPRLTEELPACLSYAGNLALVSQLAEADTADAVLTKVSVRSATDFASVVSAGGELGFSLLLEYH